MNSLRAFPDIFKNFIGPREPWHDIHCRLIGPVAYDVYLNFYERWSRQCSKYGRLDPLCDPSLFAIPETEVEPAGWRCQVFRSITSDSAVFHPTKSAILNSKKGKSFINTHKLPILIFQKASKL